MKKIILLISMFICSFAYNVTVSIVPQKMIVKAIGGNKVNVNIMVLAGNSPATYEPKISQLKALKNSKIYFAIKVPFENAWLDKFKSINSNMKIVDMGKLVKREYLNVKKGVKDPHIWLSPAYLMLEARLVLNELVKIDSKNSAFYENNYKKFIVKLSNLDMNILTMLKNVKNRKFIVFHPSFGYFARLYGFEQIAIEKNGKESSFKNINAVIQLAKKYNIKRVLVAPEFSQKSAKIIANAIGGKVVSMSPLKKDVIKNILSLAKVVSGKN